MVHYQIHLDAIRCHLTLLDMRSSIIDKHVQMWIAPLEFLHQLSNGALRRKVGNQHNNTVIARRLDNLIARSQTFYSGPKNLHRHAVSVL